MSLALAYKPKQYSGIPNSLLTLWTNPWHVNPVSCKTITTYSLSWPDLSFLLAFTRGRGNRACRLFYWLSHSQRWLAIGCAVGVAGEVYSTAFEEHTHRREVWDEAGFRAYRSHRTDKRTRIDLHKGESFVFVLEGKDQKLVCLSCLLCSSAKLRLMDHFLPCDAQSL